MLTLKNITKVYGDGESCVKALKGINLTFRESEFVAILGHSGCGKTTLLNIVGGLDRYTEGDLVINNKSTKDFKDRDWDTYRNHSVGFVFQSYNLIPHQTVLKNVELALTLSGVKGEERKQRALDALNEVGLLDQAKKLPNQLSGGQMQRVAIARAIVNNPDIILADEPTGALDTDTSIQVMEILKELSKNRLVVMVTHNGELAETYATRIITLKDGFVTGDTLPVKADEVIKPTPKKDGKKSSMGLLTAFSLSLNNLFTKKGRTILTSLAGSIGIIGIALILSISTGFNGYVKNIQRDTLSNYPITVSSTSLDYQEMFLQFFSNMNSTTQREEPEYPTTDLLTSHNVINNLVMDMAPVISPTTTDLSGFTQYLNDYLEKNDCSDIISAVKYSYGFNMELFSEEQDGNFKKVYPFTAPEMETVIKNSPIEEAFKTNATLKATISYYYEVFTQMLSYQSAFGEMINNTDLIESQYEVLEGTLPTEPNQAILVVDSYNQVDDLGLYSLGLMNDNDIRWIFYQMVLSMLNIDKTESQIEEELGYKRSEVFYDGLAFKDLIGLTYKVTTYSDYYERTTDNEGNLLTKKIPAILDDNGNIVQEETYGNFWSKRTTESLNNFLKNDSQEVKIVGVVRLKKGVASGCLSGTVCYTPALTSYMQDYCLESDIIKDYENKLRTSSEDVNEFFNIIYKQSGDYTFNNDGYTQLGKKIGFFDKDTPKSIKIYPLSYESKDKIIKIINDYNAQADEDEKIKYSDPMGTMVSSITKIINAVSYVLIAFVSISLIVSSIMIGIITYISVLERTKEIGVLRSVGASKRDISRVFNAETFIIGALSGVMGILITLLLNIPINLIITALSGLENVAKLPVVGAVLLITISVVLTVVAGLIPSKLAAKKDPVVALRTE